MIRHDNCNINDNRFLCSLDMLHATQKETLVWLTKILDNETDKPIEEQDQDLIVECLSCIDDLLEEEVTVSDEALERTLEKIKQEAADKKSENLSVKINGKKRMLKALLAVAASFTVLFSGVAIAAATKGYDSAWTFLKDNLYKIIRMEPGDSISSGDISFSKNGEFRTYNSLSELLLAEKYDFMTFDYLPEDVQLQQVIEEKVDDTRFRLIFLFDNPDLSITVFNYQNVPEDELKQYPLYQTSNMNFHIQNYEEKKYYAMGYTNGYEYQIVYNDYNELLKILDNMKGSTS